MERPALHLSLLTILCELHPVSMRPTRSTIKDGGVPRRTDCELEPESTHAGTFLSSHNLSEKRKANNHASLMLRVQYQKSRAHRAEIASRSDASRASARHYRAHRNKALPWSSDVADSQVCFKLSFHSSMLTVNTQSQVALRSDSANPLPLAATSLSTSQHN
jgi:hypothetical protein